MTGSRPTAEWRITAPWPTNPNGTAVDPATWRRFTIEAVRLLPGGTEDRWYIQTLQPLNWLQHAHTDAAGLLSLESVLDLAEMEVPQVLVGRITAVDAAPGIADDPGRVVLTTVNHLNDFVFDLTLADASGDLDTLGVTGWHKFFSEDRQTWVSASELHEGEQLRGESDPIRVLSLVSLPGLHRVLQLHRRAGPRVRRGRPDDADAQQWVRAAEQGCW